MNDVLNLFLPKKLKEFIEKEFQVMRKYEREEKELRDKRRPALKKIRYRESKRIKRKYNRQLAKLEREKSQGLISEEIYQEGILNARKRMDEEFQTMDPSKVDGREIGLIGGPLGRGRPKGESKTKDTFNSFNIFVLRCCYLIDKDLNRKSEEDRKNYSLIYRWIYKFLKSKGYVKSNGNHYTENDIKRINFKLEEEKNYAWKKDFQKLFEDKYRRFQNPNQSIEPDPLMTDLIGDLFD